MASCILSRACMWMPNCLFLCLCACTLLPKMAGLLQIGDNPLPWRCFHSRAEGGMWLPLHFLQLQHHQVQRPQWVHRSHYSVSELLGEQDRFHHHIGEVRRIWVYLHYSFGYCIFADATGYYFEYKYMVAYVNINWHVCPIPVHVCAFWFSLEFV